MDKKKDVDMDIANSIQEQMPKAVAYATRLISDSNENPQILWFENFAVELIDYMGEDFIPYCRTVYRMLKVVMGGMANLQSDDAVDAVSDDMIAYLFHKRKEDDAKRKREEEFKENIDELQFLVRQYRKTDRFKKLISFVSGCRLLSPYNAMLVCLQKPNAKFVMTAKKWRKYGRALKPEAQNIVILRPFGPVQCVYDISDTVAVGGADYPCLSDVELMNKIDKQFVTEKGLLDGSILKKLIDGLPYYGISFNQNLRAANTYAGRIQKYSLDELKLTIGEGDYMYHDSVFSLSVNSNYGYADVFRTICHEFAHLLCEHIDYDIYENKNGGKEEGQPRSSKMSRKECEFEAETVAWLVCKRAGVESRSVEYLAMYATDDEIPICSLEAVMKAVAEIEKIIFSDGKVKIKDTLWYKRDKEFKQRVDWEIKQRKENKQEMGRNAKLLF